MNAKLTKNELTTKALVLAALEDNFRAPTNGGFRAKIGEVPAAYDHTEQDRDTYRGRFKGWVCTYHYPTVAVRKNWLHKVADAGIAVLDEMLTLDARRLARRDTRNGETVYGATWVRQGRGYDLVAEKGYIATCRGYAYHSTTSAAHAIAGLRRKMRNVSADDNARSAADLFARAAGFAGDTMVSIDDARSVGACQAGIEDWCEKVGIDADAGSVPLRRFMRGLAISPRREALATLAHVLRREAGRGRAAEAS